MQYLSPDSYLLRGVTVKRGGQSGVGYVDTGGIFVDCTLGTNWNTSDGCASTFVYANGGKLLGYAFGFLSGGTNVFHFERARNGACTGGSIYYLLGDFQLPGLLGVGVGSN